jgi:hypothetical protein
MNESRDAIEARRAAREAYTPITTVPASSPRLHGASADPWISAITSLDIAPR